MRYPRQEEPYLWGSRAEGEELSYYHRDEQLSTAFLTGSNGDVQNGYLYDAFGMELEEQELFPNRIRYTGQQYDGLTGQYYLRARYYNPVYGRFMQEDVYQGDGLNLYAYCDSNPVAYYDPSGYAAAVCGNAATRDPDDQTVNTRTEQTTQGNVEGGTGSGTLSNVDARKWYLEQEAQIPDLIDDSLPLEQ